MGCGWNDCSLQWDLARLGLELETLKSGYCLKRFPSAGSGPQEPHTRDPGHQSESLQIPPLGCATNEMHVPSVIKVSFLFIPL